MVGEEIKKILLFYSMVFIMDEEPKKIEQNEPLEFVMLFNKRTKKEYIPTYKTLKHEININD